MRMMPKISVSPTPRKNSSAACDSALRLWVTKKPRRSTVGPQPPSILEGHLVAGGDGLLAREGGDDLRHRIREALGLHQLDDGAALHPLMVALADRDMPLDVLDCDRLQRLAQRIGLGALGLLDPGGQDLQRLPLLAFVVVGNGTVFLLPDCDEFLVLRVVNAEAVAHRADQPERGVARRA